MIKAVAVLCLLLTAVLVFIPAENSGVDDIFLPYGVPAYAGEGGVPVSAVAAALVEAETGVLLFAHRGDVPLPMASTTKIMTAAIALEYGKPQASFTIPKEAVGVEGSSLYLTEGEVFTVEELLYGLMLESGNDAAVALAMAVAGDVDSFVKLMNLKAAELGLKNTHFANPHGLTAEGHYTTAEELARITAYALGIEGFEEICSTKSKCLESEGHITRYLSNHNKLLSSYSGMIGVKTGYTEAAGRCLVTAARRGDMTLVAVTLNDRDDWDDHRRMLDYGFSAYRMETICEAGQSVAVPVSGGKADGVIARCQKRVRLCLPTDAVCSVIYSTEAVTAPIKKGDTVAFLKAYADGELVKKIPMLAEESVARKKKRWLFF